MGEIVAYLGAEPPYSLELLKDSRAQIQKSLVDEVLRVRSCVMPSDILGLAMIDNCLCMYSELKERPPEEYNWVSGRLVGVMGQINNTLHHMGLGGHVRGSIAPEKGSTYSGF